MKGGREWTGVERRDKEGITLLTKKPRRGDVTERERERERETNWIRFTGWRRDGEKRRRRTGGSHKII